MNIYLSLITNNFLHANWRRIKGKADGLHQALPIIMKLLLIANYIRFFRKWTTLWVGVSLCVPHEDQDYRAVIIGGAFIIFSIEGGGWTIFLIFKRAHLLTYFVNE